MNREDLFLYSDYLHYLWLLPVVLAGLLYTRKNELKLFARFSGNWKKLSFIVTHPPFH